uniref:DUF834 domain-containing protein n=1 Tax=Oryza sativa subsp. japonica TaxID=39947 RepID=Q8LNB5_ORYSJ|nr:Hypothetical protein [Oryza sativa Japonica Group]
MLTSARRPARVEELAGARAIGRAIGGHLRVEGNEANPLVLTTTANGARRRPATRRKAAAVRVDGGERAPVVGGERGGAAGLPLTTAHLSAATASGGDGGDGAAALPKTAGGGGELGARRGGARRHGRARERGQTEEENKEKLYMALDRRDRAPNWRNRFGKKSNSVFRDKTKRIRFGDNTQRISLFLEGKERGDREEQNPSINWKNPGRIWAETAAQDGGSGSVSASAGGRRRA